MIVGAILAHVAASDCELVRPGLIAQPANTVSSLGYLAVGVVLLARARGGSGRVGAPLPGRRGDETEPRRPLAGARRGLDRCVALGLMAIGTASAAFHGPGGELARWSHDFALAMLLVAAALRVGTRPLGSPSVPGPATFALASGGAGLAVVLAVVPGAGTPLAGGLAAGALAAHLWRGRRGPGPSGLAGLDRHLALPGIGLLAAAAFVHLVSRTGGPLCSPASLLQGHAAWHLLSALAAGALALSARTGSRDPTSVTDQLTSRSAQPAPRRPSSARNRPRLLTRAADEPGEAASTIGTW